MKAALIGVLLTAGFAAFCRWGIPAIVQAIKGKTSLKVRALIAELAAPVADIVETIGKHYNWKGEDKLLEAIKRLEEYIGIELGPDEEAYAKEQINEAVAVANVLADSTKPGQSFKEFILRERNGGVVK